MAIIELVRNFTLRVPYRLYATVLEFECDRKRLEKSHNGLDRKEKYLGGSHAPLGWVESDKPLWLPELSQWPIKDHRGTSVSGCLPLDNRTYRLLGFENKFSPPFEFETGARIEPI